MINGPVANWVHRVRLFDDLFFDSLFIFVEVEPDDVAAMRHKRSYVTIAQMKYPFNDLLFCLFDGALFRAFVDNGLDLIFRDGPVLGRSDGKEFKEQVAAGVQQPDDGMGDKGKGPHRPGYEPCDLFGTKKTDALGYKLSENDR